MKNIIIHPGRNFGGTITAPPSKSQAQRMLICSALADGPTVLSCSGVCDDISAAIRCLGSLGALISSADITLLVRPVVRGYRPLRPALLNCGESAAVLRFLLPVAGALGLDAAFTGGKSLAQRPLEPLYSQLALHGMKLRMSNNGIFPIHCRGELTGGRFFLEGAVSSQFVSGLMMALPLLNEDSEILTDGRLQSLSYTQMTSDVQRLFGVTSEFDGQCFRVRGNQHYRSAGELSVEGDWSAAAFWLVAGAISGTGVSCRGLNILSAQGDRRIVDIIKAFGGKPELVNDSVFVCPSELHAVDIDAGDIPDLVPPIAVLAAAAQGKTRIYNASRLRYKESDRITSLCSMLGNLGITTEAQADGLTVYGGKIPKGGVVDSHGDHRIAMAASVAALLCNGAVTVTDAEAVSKSYPGFFDDYRSAGGVVSLSAITPEP